MPLSPRDSWSMRSLRAVLFVAPLCALAAASGAPAAPAALDYNRDIKPILAENCFACHGFDEKSRKAKLRLDLADSAYADRDGVTPIKPGDPAQSEAWQRIMSPHEDEVMPPPDSHRTLTSEQKQRIKTWIEQGAVYAQHWAFVAPRKADLPANSATATSSDPTSDATQGAQAIDAFVNARLSAEKITPTAEADRRTLIRRLSFDLTGLPPSAEEADAFAQDQKPDAYRRVVDRLLASPHFGERLALDWLDAARYADTNGFSIDGGRHMWLWRDWVIQAFNDNKPYDRFLLEQLAGDLLPNRTDADLIATGFQRNNMVTHEGGTIPEENLTNYNVDRVKTLGEAVLGLTLGCAQCHDHKFDPITQRDYYQVYAFFNSLGDRGLDGNGGVNPGPFMEARTVLKTGEESALQQQIAALKSTLARRDDSILKAWTDRERTILATRGRDFATHEAKILKVSTPNRGSGVEIDQETRVRLSEPGELAAYDVSLELPKLSAPITGIRVVVFPQEHLPGGGWGRGPRTARVPRREPAAPAKAAKAAKMPAAAPTENDPAKGTFRLTALALTPETVASDQVNLHKLHPISRVTANTWDPQHRPAGSLDPRNDDGWSPALDATGPVHLTATLETPIDATATPFLTVQVNFGAGRALIPGLFQIQLVTGTDDDSNLPKEIVAALQVPEAERTPEITAQLWAYCASQAPELQVLRTALANLEDRFSALTQKFSTMVMNVAPKPRDTFILNRGDYAQPTTEKVAPQTPAALPPMPPGAPADRLGLAQWLASPDHPLTARVAVNRLWRLFFETPLVMTPADFGTQGDWPSHPELLDWLAVDFREHGWDLKRLARQIVMSAAYRRSSAATAELNSGDPQNRLLARGPRFRLPAEFVRDHALKVAGLLVPRVGGPSVNPYMPLDLWREVSHYGSTPATSQTFVQDHGEKLYRRSLYTYWKRTAPPPNLSAFDAPNREVCVVTRGNTTTPLQALVLLNDTQFVEAARVFAERMLQRPGDDGSRLRWAFSETTARIPTAKELQVLQGALTRERQRYTADAAAAEKLLALGESPRSRQLSAPEHAAWTQVGALLLNLSESITRN